MAIIVKIVNKSKKGVTVKLNGKTFFVDWEYFNEKFQVDPNDKFSATLKTEEEGKMCEVIELAEEGAKCFIMSQSLPSGPVKLGYLAKLGEIAEKMKRLGVDNPQEYIAIVVDDFRKSTATIEHKETPEEYKARKEREKQTVPSSRTTECLGNNDVLKKLKESFKK